MKRTGLLHGFMAMLALLVIFSCTEEMAEYTPDAEAISGLEDEESIRRYFNLRGKLIILSPSGDMTGQTDADAIQTAVNDLDDGGAIFLRKGDYYLNHTVYADNFAGKILSFGKNKTKLTAVGNESVPFDGFVMIQFWQPTGKIEMANMSMILQEGLWAIGDGQWEFGNMTDFIHVILTSEGSDTDFRNLDLIGTRGGAGAENGFFIDQPANSIRVQGDFSNFPSFSSGGKHSLTHTNFVKAGLWAHLYEGLNGAEIKVERNTYSEFKQTNYRFLSSSKLRIKNNEMDGYELGSIVITQERSPVEGGNNSVEIKNNRVRNQGYMPIEIGVVEEGKAGFDLKITKNDLTNTGPGPGGFSNFAVIGLFGGTQNALVKENKLSGEASFGVYTENESNGRFICNDLSNMNPYDADYLIRGENNLVSADDVSSVLDEGTNTTIEESDCDGGKGKKGKGKKGKGKKG